VRFGWNSAKQRKWDWGGLAMSAGTNLAFYGASKFDQWNAARGQQRDPRCWYQLPSGWLGAYAQGTEPQDAIYYADVIRDDYTGTPIDYSMNTRIDDRFVDSYLTKLAIEVEADGSLSHLLGLMGRGKPYDFKKYYDIYPNLADYDHDQYWIDYLGFRGKFYRPADIGNMAYGLVSQSTTLAKWMPRAIQRPFFKLAGGMLQQIGELEAKRDPSWQYFENGQLGDDPRGSHYVEEGFSRFDAEERL
jgi:hypothetical protein